MNIEPYVNCWNAGGSGSSVVNRTYWTEMSRGFSLNLPPYGIIDLDEDEMARLFSQPGVLGLKYSTEPQGNGQAGAIYLLSDKSYDLTKLGRSTRRHTRRGLGMCRVEQIGFDELKAKGMQANLDTLCRQKRGEPMSRVEQASAQPGWAGRTESGAASCA